MKYLTKIERGMNEWLDRWMNGWRGRGTDRYVR